MFNKNTAVKAEWFGGAREACAWDRHRDEQNTAAASFGGPFFSHPFLFTFHYGDKSKHWHRWVLQGGKMQAGFFPDNDDSATLLPWTHV